MFQHNLYNDFSTSYHSVSKQMHVGKYLERQCYLGRLSSDHSRAINTINKQLHQKL